MEEEKNTRRPGRPRLNKRTKEQQAYDTNFCTNLFLRGHTYREIAEKLRLHHIEVVGGIEYTISHVQVMKDMQRVLIEWKRNSLETVDDYLRVELEKLDKIEAEAWAAWEVSKAMKTRKKNRNFVGKAKAYVDDIDEDGNQKEVKPIYEGYNEEATETTSGNPKFMDIILNAMQSRARLLGLNSPEKVDLVNDRQNNTDRPVYEKLDIDESTLFALADSMQQKAFQSNELTKGLPN